MSSTLKISGKKFKIAESGSQTWKFSRRPGGWVIAEGEGGVRKRIMVCEQRGHWGVSSGGRIWSGEWSSDQPETTRGGKFATDSELTAQFPGKVRKILVEENAMVSEGDPLILVEAMKMEFAIRAPASGKVVRILVQEGQQLLPGDRFVEFEGTPSVD